MYKYSYLLCVFLIPFIAYSQSTLTAGDIAFTGYTSDGTDQFSFVLTVNISSGTQIRFTDKGYLDASGFVSSSETEVVWTALSAMSKGDQVLITGNSASAGSVSGTALSFSSGGDQVFAYQGSQVSPSFIAGLHNNVEPSGYGSSDPTLNTTTSNWDGSANTSDESMLPNSLTNGSTAVWTYDLSGTVKSGGDWEIDNVRYIYSTSFSSMTRAEILASVNDRANWELNDVSGFSLPPTLIASANTAPTFTVTPPNQTICYQDNTGNIGFILNDPETDPLTVTATSSNTSLIPNGNISVGGSYPNYTISVNHSGTNSGTATITINADDGTDNTDGTFDVTVRSPLEAGTVQVTP